MKLKKIEGIDVLNETLLLDIKPYSAKFNAVEGSMSGWLQASEAEVRDKR